MVLTVERLAAITGLWFDEGYEAGRLDPAELARRIAADPSLFDAARQQGAAEERARLLRAFDGLVGPYATDDLVTRIGSVRALLASPPDAEPPAEERT